MKLVDRAIEPLRCPEGRKDLLFFDDSLKGFGLRVTAAGKRIFVFQYRSGKQVRRVVLGYWGEELTAAQARRKAEMLRGQVRDGRDPVAERKATQAVTAAAEAETRAAMAVASYTVQALIEEWTQHHLAERSASYRHRVPADLRRAFKNWLLAPAVSLERIDAVGVLDAVKVDSGPVAANRLRAVARACWSWAVKRGSLPVNPWEFTPRPLQRERARERVLTDGEVGTLYTVAATLAEPWGVLVRLLILTGQRRGEVSGIRWDELDLSAGQWSLTGSRTKNGVAHVVPLTPEAVALLRSVKRRQGAVFVFEGPSRTAVTGFGKLKSRLDAALLAAADGGKVPAPWVLHDLRRTVATGLQRLGVRLEVTEALLNHISGSRAGIVGVYQQHGWAKEKAEALAAWNAHVASVARDRQTVDRDIRPGITPTSQGGLLALVS